MATLIVSDSTVEWEMDLPGVEFLDATQYLTDPNQAERRNVKLFNLCRSLKHQSTGYYVSLLAEARGHRPVPGVIAIQDMKSQTMIRSVSEELDEMIQKAFSTLQSDQFELSVYFVRNLAKRYEKLARHLFNIFQIPLLRIRLVKNKSWMIRSVKALGTNDIPASHQDFLIESARKYFTKSTTTRVRQKRLRYDLAILHDPQEKENSPSDEAALRKFSKAAEKVGIASELITRDDTGRLLEFDALFIRQTTAMNHFTYRLARKATSEGLIVIDDPVSIARCTNKVYLAELLNRHHIAIPQTLILHQKNINDVADVLGFPCVLKKPDSSFSQGVIKVKSQAELDTRIGEFLNESELVVAQQFLPTTFDWRIGILDQKPLFACQYYMAPGHWQIIQQEKDGRGRYGKSKTVPVELAPRKAVQLAVKAANLIGNGLYGVDVKESDGKFVIIEVNDNPNIDVGCEDAILKDELYLRIMELFLKRIEQVKTIGRQ